jgi:hypothetical protein
MAITFTERMKMEAKTVMKITFWDGNVVCFFGLGTTRNGEKRLSLELIRHKRNVANRIDHVCEAVIYKNRYPAKDGGKEDILMKFEKGVWS